MKNFNIQITLRIKKNLTKAKNLIIYYLRYTKYIWRLILWKLNQNKKINSIIKIISNKKSLFIKVILIVFIILSSLIFVFRLGKQRRTLTIFRDPQVVDTTIKHTTGQYNFENTTNTFKSYFKSNPLQTKAIKFSNNKAAITFSTSPVQSFGNFSFEKSPKVEKNAITYENVFPNIDLKYSVSSTRLLEEFIVKDKNIAINTEKIIQDAETIDVDEYKEDDGKIIFYKKEKEVFIIPQPVIYEQDNTEISSFGIKYEISKTSNNVYSITKVITDEGIKWLNDPARQYPIVIDLVINNADTASSWVSSDTTNTVVSDESTIKYSGTGSVKVGTTVGSLPEDVDTFDFATDQAARASISTTAITATGGTIATASGYTIHTFTTSGTFNVNSANGGDIEVLVVAGGGGGGSDMGGGGGGGGVVYDDNYTVTAETPITVTVGNGGAGAPAGVSQIRGYNGENSVFGTITAIGGGGGASEFGNNNSPAGNGGSGGGVAGSSSTTYGTGTSGQGYNGGGSGGSYYPGGGGGAGGPGRNSPANGGPGLPFSINGTLLYYGGGGGGAGYSNIAGNGGLGGGGGGAPKVLVTGGGLGGGQALNSGSDGTIGTLVSQTNVPGGNGGANTGGGGGGGAHYNSNNYGGNGGSGVVIVRYPTNGYTTSGYVSNASGLNATGGIITYVASTSGTYKVHMFKQSDSFNILSGSGDIEVLVVAGGGGGGSDMGGGGGGGGVVYDSSYAVTPSKMAVTVGNGGAGAPAGVSQIRGYNGENSVFGTITAIGGGGGASEFGNNNSPAGNGGSGGGAAGCSSTTYGTGTSGQGYNGGGSGGCYYPGGGGGAGGAGSNTPANGGIGYQSSITGATLYYGGGGGGAGYSGIAGNGGLGGGGGGGPMVSGGGLGGGNALSRGKNATAGTLGAQTNVPGGNGGANTGGGGGGGAHYNSNNYGGSGGSGVVIVRYLIPPLEAFSSVDFSATGGTISTSSGNTIHTFLSSGNLTVYSGSKYLEVMTIGGGGGGGSDMGGGGGAGGYIYYSSYPLVANNYRVTIGTGGAGGPAGINQLRGANGLDSVFNDIFAFGGGGGGSEYSTNTNIAASGGSGGGAASSSNLYGNDGTSGQGNNGGDSGGSYYPGGGGGAGGAGGNSPGNGGVGIQNDIMGTNYYWAGGGGGAGYSNIAGNGGLGGGGGGAPKVSGGGLGGGSALNSGSDGAVGTLLSQTNVPGGNAGANTGGGGGGGSHYNSNNYGGTGGSGIVVISYPTPTGTIKTEGTHALKGVAQATTSLNKTLIKTLDTPLDLTGIITDVTFDIRSSRTGSNIKIGLHDSGGTTTEITPNIVQTDTFQSESIDLTGVASANKDAIDQIIITIVNADTDNTFYLDNMKSETPASVNDTVTLTKTATDLSNYNNLSFWIRSNLVGQTLRFQFGETDSSEQNYNITINSANIWEKKSWDISSIPIDNRNAVTLFAFKITDSSFDQTFYFDEVLAGLPPTTPTFSVDYLHDKVKTSDTTPEVRFSTTDSESDELTYQISWDTDSSFATETTKTSDADAGFVDITDGGDTDPFDSGNTISYTFQSALTDGTTYFYRVKAKDPTGSNTYSSWSSTRSLTIDTTLPAGNHWFETHADQFSTDTLSTTIVDETNNNIYTPPSNTTIDMMEYSSDADAQTAYLSDGLFYATGGTIATASGYTIHTFTSSGTFSVSSSRNVEVLVVAGGGGGGAYTGQTAGGGGGGGLVEHSAYSASGDITVTVGGGGSRGTGSSSGSNGNNSIFGDITANGGGGGGGQSANGLNGGSGGGGGQKTGGTSGGSATQGSSGGGTGYGSNGGGGGVNYAGSGGGAGGTPTGRSNSISGSPVTYSTGGAAGYSGDGSSGASNTGNGGGGGGTNGGNGGSGIVIVKYPSIQPLLSYSESTTKSQGSYSLKGVATITESLNKTLTRTVSPTINLSDFNTLKYDIRSTRTGSNIKIAIHDSGGTTTETTPNVTVANTFQTKSWDISGIANADKDAIDQIIITIVNADAENTFYIDNLYGESPTGGTGSITSTAITQANINSGKTNWGTAVIGKTETYGSIKVQAYYDNSGTPTIIPDEDLSGNSNGFSETTVDLSEVSTSTYPTLYLKGNLVYTEGSPTLDDWGVYFNAITGTPSLDLPTNSAVSQATRTIFKTTATDSDSDYLRYKIQVCTNSGMTENCQTFDQTSSQDGWSGQNIETNTAYTSGTQATYIVQTILIPSTTYYWRSYAIDPGGLNLWGDTQLTPYSFTTSDIPEIPSLDLPTDTATNQSVYPVLKTTTTDNDSDYLKYKIQICKDLAMTTDCSTFNQASSQDGWSGQDANGGLAYASGTQAVYTIQSQLDFDTTYYWRSYAIDPVGSETWSSTQTTPYSFTTGDEPTQPTELWVESVSNPVGVTDLTPEFSAICNHSVEEANLVKYRIQVDNDANFSSTIWDTGESGTVMSNCLAGSRSSDISYAGSTLSLDGTIYYWRIKFWDEWTIESIWSTQQAFFAMDKEVEGDMPTSCRIKTAVDDTSLTLLWNDNSSTETQYRIERNVNSAGFSLLVNKDPDSTNHADSTVSSGNTYQYRVRAEGSSNSEWCTTTIADLSLGNFEFKGLNIKGINLR